MRQVVAFVVVVIAVVIVVARTYKSPHATVWPGSFCGGVVADLEPTAYTHV